MMNAIETTTDKLRCLRKLCQACNQPLYVEILDEALAAFEAPTCDGILEVRPCVNRLGHVVSYDLCPPHEEGATAGPVLASVYGGEGAAQKLAAAWNACAGTSPARSV